MELIYIEFEKNLVIERGNMKITLTPFETLTYGTVSLGVEAPRSVAVNREEIYKQKQEKRASEVA